MVEQQKSNTGMKDNKQKNLQQENELTPEPELSIADHLENFNNAFEKSKPKPMVFLSICAGLFTTASLVAIYIGRKRGIQAVGDAQAISGDPMRLAIRAFGVATLGTVSVFGASLTAATLYLNSVGVTTVPEFTEFMKSKLAAKITPIESRTNTKFDPELDEQLVKLESWDRVFPLEPKDPKDLKDQKD